MFGKKEVYLLYSGTFMDAVLKNPRMLREWQLDMQARGIRMMKNVEFIHVDGKPAAAVRFRELWHGAFKKFIKEGWTLKDDRLHDTPVYEFVFAEDEPAE